MTSRPCPLATLHCRGKSEEQVARIDLKYLFEQERGIEEVAEQARVSGYLWESAGVVCTCWTHTVCTGSL